MNNFCAGFKESIPLRIVLRQPALAKQFFRMGHRMMIVKVLAILQSNLDQKLSVFNLLPEVFTKGNLQTLCETILGKKLLRANFQRKMLSLEMLELVDKKRAGQVHRPICSFKSLNEP